jgi:lactate racemase
MNHSFAFQNSEITFEIPDTARVFQSAPDSKIGDVYTSVIKHLLRPLGYRQSLFDLAKTCKTACVVVDALCPPDFIDQMIGPIVKTLHAAGMNHNDILFLAASEYPAIFAKDTVAKMLEERYKGYDVQIHQMSSPENHVFIGNSKQGVPIYLDARLQKTDLKIIAGGIHSHSLFGFSGASLLMPFGLANLETISALFEVVGTDCMEDFRLVNTGSKLFNELDSIFELAQLDFIFNIFPDRGMNVTDIFSGKPHHVLKSMMLKLNKPAEELPAPADVVITSPGCARCNDSWNFFLQSLGIAASYVKKNGALVFITSLFDEMSEEQLVDLKNMNGLTKLLSGGTFIQNDKDPYHCYIGESIVLFISPNIRISKQIFDKRRALYFFSSIDQAMSFLQENVKKSSDVLILPQALYTNPRPSIL